MSAAATRRDHKQFCETEDWDLVRDARGRAVRHHVTYELHLQDGRILRTRVSRPVNGDSYGPGLWSTILKDQLDVTAEQFWACVRDGVLPPRPGATAPVLAETLPASLAWQLVHTLGLSGDEVSALTREQAVARMVEHWATPPPD